MMKEEGRLKIVDIDKQARRIDLILRLFSGGGAAVVAIAVAAILLDCEFERVIIVGFNAAWCSPTVRIAGAVSVSAGVGFLAFLILEGNGMILASMWLERKRKEAEQQRVEEERLRREEAERAEQLRREEAERSERRIAAAERMAEAAERRADAAEQLRREEAERNERMAEAAERRADAAEQLRREESERAERRRREEAERNERREERLLALLERRNGGGAVQRDADDEDAAG